MNKPLPPTWLSRASLHDVCSRRSDLAVPCSTCGAKEFNVCEPLEPSRQARLFEQATRLSWGKREPMFLAGDSARHIFNITEGAVSLSRTMPDGRRQIFGFLLPGDFVGLEIGQTYSFDAEAITEVKACRFSRPAFDAFMRDNADVALRMVRLMSNEVAQSARHEMMLGRKTAVERVASFLLDLRARSAARHLRTQPLQLPMTRTEIADYTGLTIETVSRVFGRLKSGKVIELVGSGAVRLLDEDKLRALAESGE